MVKPQQPELRRSDLGATSDDSTKVRLTAPSTPAVDGGVGGPIPEDNLPGHHPEHEQDKPSGRDFVAKMHALAQAEEAEQSAADDEPAEDGRGRKLGPAQSRDDEVLDLTDVKADKVHTGSEGPQHVGAAAPSSSHIADRLASIAGKPFAIAGGVLGAVRNRLPGS